MLVCEGWNKTQRKAQGFFTSIHWLEIQINQIVYFTMLGYNFVAVLNLKFKFPVVLPNWDLKLIKYSFVMVYQTAVRKSSKLYWLVHEGIQQAKAARIWLRQNFPGNLNSTVTSSRWFRVSTYEQSRLHVIWNCHMHSGWFILTVVDIAKLYGFVKLWNFKSQPSPEVI